jgi:hypothetical protein
MATAVEASDVAMICVTEEERYPPPPLHQNYLWLLYAVSFEPEAEHISLTNGKDKE